MGEFLARLKQRNLVQLALAYIAAAFTFSRASIVAQRLAGPMPSNASMDRTRDAEIRIDAAGRYSRWSNDGYPGS